MITIIYNVEQDNIGLESIARKQHIERFVSTKDDLSDLQDYVSNSFRNIDHIEISGVKDYVYPSEGPIHRSVLRSIAKSLTNAYIGTDITEMVYMLDHNGLYNAPITTIESVVWTVLPSFMSELEEIPEAITDYFGTTGIPLWFAEDCLFTENEVILEIAKKRLKQYLYG